MESDIAAIRALLEAHFNFGSLAAGFGHGMMATGSYFVWRFIRHVMADRDE